MCSRVRYLLVCAFMILLSPLLSAAADLESAKRAYEDKDYAKALKEAENEPMDVTNATITRRVVSTKKVSE